LCLLFTQGRKANCRQRKVLAIRLIDNLLTVDNGETYIYLLYGILMKQNDTEWFCFILSHSVNAYKKVFLF